MLRLPSLPLVRAAPPTPRFFNPSYRSLSRPQLTLSSLAGKPIKANTPRRCSFSSGARGSNSSSSRRSSARPAGAGKQARPANAPAPTTPVAPSVSNIHSNPASTSNGVVAPPNAIHSGLTANGGSDAAAAAATAPKALAAALPHVTPTLVNLDNFFALERPLLELPIRLHMRKSTSPAAPVLRTLSSLAATVDQDDLSDEMNALELNEAESELAEIVDLGPDGKPVGTPYFTMVGESQTIEPLRSVEEEREIELKQEAEAALEHEQTMQALEEEELDPYDAWLIGEPEGVQYAPLVARYLASRSPFVAPSPPTPFASAPAVAQSLSGPSSHSPETVSNLTFLRPFPKASPSIPVAASSSAPSTSSLFAAQLANPLTPTAARQHADRFLSSASLTHRWQAQHDFDSSVARKLERASRSYGGITTRGRRTNTRSQNRDQLRVWTASDGWQVADLKAAEAEGLFLSAELVDLDWIDEGTSTTDGRDGVQLDSTRRKRKKKMTKHKYKKRRKAQRALRQRLGK